MLIYEGDDSIKVFILNNGLLVKILKYTFTQKYPSQTKKM